MSQLAADRQRQILGLAREHGRVVISDVASELGVSEMTLRRDLKELDQQGLLQRVHGGAIPIPEARFETRLGRQNPEKAKAAEKLVPFLPRTGSIYLDGSTTMLHLVSHLRETNDLQVVTNHLETFQRLTQVKGVEPLLIGGKLDPRTGNLVGALALRSLLAIAFDAAFFSAWGIAPSLGLMEVTLEDAEVKDLVASRATNVYVAIDSSKLGNTGNGSWSPDRSKTTLATSLQLKDKRLHDFSGRYKTIL